jgi:hypothetical protein
MVKIVYAIYQKFARQTSNIINIIRRSDRRRPLVVAVVVVGLGLWPDTLSKYTLDLRSNP